LKPAELQPRRPASKAPAWQTVCVCVFLALAVWAVFGQTARFGFVNYDDKENVYENPVVEKGLSVQAVGWAFTHVQMANWVPLTTLSHMFDCQVFGLNAGGHHMVNVLWHAATAVLLFLMLRRITGSLWRSAFVAAVFAVHPLRAESVAWVSERKDVLSGFFFMLTLWAYVRYTEECKMTSASSVEPQNAKCKIFYAVAVFWFVLGLLAKSMVATLPFVLLLLDYWPLGRLQHAPQFLRLLKEKIPLFVLAAGSCVTTALVPSLVVTGASRLPLLERLGNALVSYGVYLWQMVFPAGLATPYPNPPNGQPLWKICLALVLLAGISAGVILCRNKRPFLLTGWLWYLGMLFPVIGIIQISPDASHADRYTYLPGIGLAIGAIWAAADGSAGWKHRRLALGGLMMAVAGALMVRGHIQTSYWKDSQTLWTRALDCNSRNCVARYNLGNAFFEKGDRPSAIEQYRKALDINADYAKARNNLGNALYSQGDREEAIAQYRKALDINPDYAEVRYNLGNALLAQGDREAAIAQFRKALDIEPDHAQARNNLGNALFAKGNLEEAIAQYRKAMESKPDFAELRNNLGAALLAKRDREAAIAQFQKSLEIKPGQIPVQNELAWLLATTPEASLRNGPRARALAEQASQLSGGGNPMILRTLAAAYAEEGNYSQAAATARRALELAVRQKNDALGAALPKEIQLYEANTPLRDAPRRTGIPIRRSD
jgi:tetratricopeptide (TPR) repeat protein